MSEASSNSALPFIAWARIWSPVVPEDLRSEAWDSLELEDHYEKHKTDYWSTFHSGMPSPKVPLLLHAALDMDGSAAREDWLRVISHLDLQWDDMHLPPDQLGVCCDIYACAIEREETVLIKELRDRYLLPWCEFGSNMLRDENHPMTFMVDRFRESLEMCGA